jgi:hypothetical protein
VYRRRERQSTSMASQIQPAGDTPEKEFSNRGGTVHPVYGDRKPMMYHLFESEMVSVSSLNTVALSFFSVGAFLASCVIAIVIGWGFAPSPLSEFASFMCHRAVYFVAILSLMLFGFGIWAVWRKKGIIDLIKKETSKE